LLHEHGCRLISVVGTSFLHPWADPCTALLLLLLLLLLPLVLLHRASNMRVV
jgi:ABC-type transport system involved in cytochrome bd biosynthesis fused ATPase/permease subunit